MHVYPAPSFALVRGQPRFDSGYSDQIKIGIMAVPCLVRQIKLNKKRWWDGKWSLVIFDVPHSQKKIRDALRAKLRELEFYAIQKSVFIVPYKCEDEIDFITTLMGVREHVLILNVASFEGDEKLRHYFRVGEFKGSA